MVEPGTCLRHRHDVHRVLGHSYFHFPASSKEDRSSRGNLLRRRIVQSDGDKLWVKGSNGVITTLRSFNLSSPRLLLVTAFAVSSFHAAKDIPSIGMQLGPVEGEQRLDSYRR